MALLFSDSFAHYLLADILRKWDETTGTLVIAPEYGAFGMNGLRLTNTAGTAGSIGKTIPNSATFVVGVWVYFETIRSATDSFLKTLDAGTTQLELRTNASGQLIVARNGTVLFTSTNALVAGTWYHVEFKGTIHPTTGSFEVRVNGTSTGWVPNQTGQNTRASANSYVNKIQAVYRESNSSAFIRCAGVYVLDDTGTPNTFLGVCRPFVARPAGAGTNAAWTGNYADNFANVNEEVCDGDSTFNQSATAAQKDTFEHDNVPTGSIAFVAASLTARQDAGAQRTIRPILKDAGGVRNGTSVNTSISYKTYQTHWDLNPATAAAWTASELNAAAFEAGYELVS